MFEWSTQWHECLEAFLDSLSNEHARGYYRAQLINFLGRVTSPELVTTKDIDGYITRDCTIGCRNSGQPSKASTQNVRIAILRSFYKFASNYRIIGEDGKPTRLYQDINPCANYKFLPQESTPRGLTEEEIARFFQAVNEHPHVRPLMRLRDRALFLFALATCRRIGEILSLTVGDFKREVIADERGQIHEGWVYYFIPSKKRAKVRDRMELSGMVMQAIQEYWAARPVINDDLPAFARIGAPGTEHVQIHDPYQNMARCTVNDRMKLYCEYAGLDQTLSPHVWRHTGAQWDYLHGANVLEVSHKLRHSDLATTTIYLKRLQTPVDKSIDRFEASFAHLAK